MIFYPCFDLHRKFLIDEVVIVVELFVGDIEVVDSYIEEQIEEQLKADAEAKAKCSSIEGMAVVE